MDFSGLWSMLEQQLGTFVPSLLGALVILVVGWIVAIVVRALVHRSARFLKLNQRLASADAREGAPPDVEMGLAKGVYYLVLLFVLVAFFDALKLELASAPLQGLLEKFLAYVPNLLAGLVLVGLAWLVATILRTIVSGALGATSIDDRMAAQAGMSGASQNAGKLVYWLVILLFLPAILGAFQVSGLLAPVQEMVDKMLAMVPNIIAAAVIGFVGWLVARIVRDLVSNVLAAAGADRLGESAGLSGNLTLSRLIGLVLYVLILLPALVAALQALQIDAITAPATSMLEAVMAAIPNVFAAAVILTIAYLVARTVAGLVGELLAGAGFDNLPERIGLARAFERQSPSSLVATLLLFFVMLFATVEAANRLGFGQVSHIVATFIEFGGQVLLGSVIIAVGFWLSNLAHGAITRVSGGAAGANVARFAILGLVLAMGLRAMGLADDIVNLAFGLTLGSVAIAAALAFGLGGREAAGRLADHWAGRIKGE
jgi:hypothetical protein